MHVRHVRGAHKACKGCIIIYPWLPLVALATIDLVGDNREFKV